MKRFHLFNFLIHRWKNNLHTRPGLDFPQFKQQYKQDDTCRFSLLRHTASMFDCVQKCVFESKHFKNTSLLLLLLLGGQEEESHVHVGPGLVSLRPSNSWGLVRDLKVHEEVQFVSVLVACS